MSAEDIPDEIWRKILEMGVKSSTFSYKDLCCISISSRRLFRLSYDDSLWHLLLLLDYPTHTDSSSSSQSPTKFIYKTRFEREKEKERKESELSERSRRIREMQAQLLEDFRLLLSISEKLGRGKTPI